MTIFFDNNGSDGGDDDNIDEASLGAPAFQKLPHDGNHDEKKS